MLFCGGVNLKWLGWYSTSCSTRNAMSVSSCSSPVSIWRNIVSIPRSSGRTVFLPKSSGASVIDMIGRSVVALINCRRVADNIFSSPRQSE